MLTAVLVEGRIEVRRQGEEGGAPFVTQNAAADARPHLHPILAPDGVGTLTEDAPPHHPWQHGLYVGLNDVNGVGFWEEGVRGNAEDGTFHPRPLKAPTTTDGRVAWNVESVWRDPDGHDLLGETQAWTAAVSGDVLVLDMAWTLSARTDLTFGEYAYGGLFLRMPYRQQRGGTMMTSEGHAAQQEAEGQRARWVAVAMQVDGRESPAGIAILDHKNNAEHPVPWRVDGQLGISPSRCIAGAWKIGKGEAVLTQYRVLVFAGDIDGAMIDDAWQQFVTQ